MSNYGKISWQSTKISSGRSALNGPVNQIDDLLELCQRHISSKLLDKSCAILTARRTELHETYKKIIDEISPQPFLAAFVLWAKEIAAQRPDLKNIPKLLLENDFIGITDKQGKTWTIAHAHGFDHSLILDAIRCKRALGLQIREQLVAAYISFMQWLSHETHGYISAIEDHDLLKTQGRLLAYPLFLNLLKALKDKEQLVAKLLYFGGSRTLDEVLNLQLEAVDFEKKSIQYESQLVSYPSHIFADIQALAGNKKRGRLFLGRQNAPLNSTTIFRNFKDAAIEVGLGQSFSPAVLTSGN